MSPAGSALPPRRRPPPALPELGLSASLPSLPSLARSSRSLPSLHSAAGTSELCSKRWTSEHRRLLHQQRERSWLRRQAKQRYIDFSDGERQALRQYFDALSEGQQQIRLETLENMLISFGLAETRDEVASLVDDVDGDGDRALDFEEYLEVLRARADSDIFLVFKAMMDGSFGDPSLNFQTVISAYRRRLILEATGARGVEEAQRDLGCRILSNFAKLQRCRHGEALAEEEAKGETPTSAAQLAAKRQLPFDAKGNRWTGGALGIMWRGVCHEEKLVSSRPSSEQGQRKGGRRAAALQKPMSPREVIEGIVKVKTSLRRKKRFGTVVVGPPEFDEDLF